MMTVSEMREALDRIVCDGKTELVIETRGRRWSAGGASIIDTKTESEPLRVDKVGARVIIHATE